MTALIHRAKGQRFNEEELNYDNLSHMVSRKTIEDCLNIICHNTNVLEANNAIRQDIYEGSPKYGNAFKKYGIPKLTRKDGFNERYIEDYYAAF